MLDINREAEALADQLIRTKAVPSNATEDALHIAVAAVHGMDLIVTCNFRHISNPSTKWLVRETVVATGYLCPEICSPSELAV